MLLDGLRKRQGTAATKLADLAKREAAGQTKASDGSMLEKLLAESGRSEGDYSRMVKVCHEAESLRTRAAKVDTTSAAFAGARSRVLEHQAETKRLIEQREGELGELVGKRNAAESAFRAADAARCALSRLEFEHAELLGLERPDLDTATLTCGAGANVLEGAGGPTIEVPPAVWNREQRRRLAITEAARERAYAEHRRSVAEWSSRVPRNLDGRPVTANFEPPPGPFVLPSWTDIVARGWPLELAREAAA